MFFPPRAAGAVCRFAGATPGAKRPVGCESAAVQNAGFVGAATPTDP